MDDLRVSGDSGMRRSESGYHREGKPRFEKPCSPTSCWGLRFRGQASGPKEPRCNKVYLAVEGLSVYFVHVLKARFN